MKRNIFVRLTAMALLIVMIVPAFIACEPLDADTGTTVAADPTEAPDITGEPDVTTDFSAGFTVCAPGRWATSGM